MSVYKDDSTKPAPSLPLPAAVEARVAALCEEGWELYDRFCRERQYDFHAFVPADYDVVLAALLPHRTPGSRFLEWGSATGVITILADLLGFEAYGIEINPELVPIARALAERYQSRARFATGSFVPAGYTWRPAGGDARPGTIGTARSGYLELGHPLEDFDVVFAFPWGGEEPMMIDIMKAYGRPDARLLLNTVNDGVLTYRGGRLEGLGAPRRDSR